MAAPENKLTAAWTQLALPDFCPLDTANEAASPGFCTGLSFTPDVSFVHLISFQMYGKGVDHFPT